MDRTRTLSIPEKCLGSHRTAMLLIDDVRFYARELEMAKSKQKPQVPSEKLKSAIYD